ncbi:MAG: hypothetical protein MHPSP_004014, partial [Paramarteilia canceri]
MSAGPISLQNESIASLRNRLMEAQALASQSPFEEAEKMVLSVKSILNTLSGEIFESESCADEPCEPSKQDLKRDVQLLERLCRHGIEK